MRRELALVENDVGAGGVSVGLNGLGGSGGFRAGVDADVAEVLAEARLEESASGSIKRMAGRAEYIAYDTGNVGGSRWCCSAALDCWLRLFLMALFAHLAVARAGTWRRCRGAGVGAHDGVGDVVGFAFRGVVDAADSELGLDLPRANELLHGLVADLLL
jgi:hypothetical protein